MTASSTETENTKKDEKPGKNKESKESAAEQKTQQTKEKSKTPEETTPDPEAAASAPQTPTEKEIAELKAIAAAGDDKQRLRKSTRATRFKSKPNVATAAHNSSNGNGTSGTTTTNKTQTKGRNRRSLFKKTPYKTPLAQATTHVVESVFYKGSYLQIGDIVSLVDNEDNVYYAQIRGLLVDDYCEKSAFLTWLIPTQESPDPRDGFDPATYLIGPDEELSRKLSCLEFVMHAPSDYYLDRSTPFPLPDSMEYDTKPGGYIWTVLPEYQRKKQAD